MRVMLRITPVFEVPNAPPVSLGNATKFFTTIAFQLSQVSSDVKHYICEAVKKHPDIAQQALRYQWKRLVFGPLAMLKAGSTPLLLVLVVDALDECNGDQDVKQILQLLAEAKTLKTDQLQIFLSSRPETPIRLDFRNMSRNLHRDLILNNVPRAIVDNAIVGSLAFNESTTQRRLHNLHSVLKVSDGQEYPIRLLHPSFRDFLLNNERCCNQNFWVNVVHQRWN